MLKNICFFFFALSVLASCQERKTITVLPGVHKNDTIPVFPVTDYIKGQLTSIESLQTTPVKIVDNGGKKDSAWIQREDVRALASPFLQPVIDSASLQEHFTGNSFLDQTVGAVTFTYVPKSDFKDDSGLREINVYIDPQTNKVQRIYLVKEKGDTTLQLTWKSGSWFSLRSIINDKVNEEKVQWGFND